MSSSHLSVTVEVCPLWVFGIGKGWIIFPWKEDNHLYSRWKKHMLQWFAHHSFTTLHFTFYQQHWCKKQWVNLPCRFTFWRDTGCHGTPLLTNSWHSFPVATLQQGFLIPMAVCWLQVQGNRPQSRVILLPSWADLTGTKNTTERWNAIALLNPPVPLSSCDSAVQLCHIPVSPVDRDA